MTILGMKLATGEDIIADVTNSGDNRFKLTRPVQIRQMPSHVPGAPPSLGFSPFPEYASDNSNVVIVEPLHVVYNYAPDENLVANYEKMLSDDTTQTTAGPQIITG